MSSKRKTKTVEPLANEAATTEANMMKKAVEFRIHKFKVEQSLLNTGFIFDTGKDQFGRSKKKCKPC